MTNPSHNEHLSGYNSNLERIFPGNSEMAHRMRAFDWSSTPLGSPETWPQNLRIALGICLTSRFPMHVWWGSDLTLFYNDGYISFLGKHKHPAVLGRSGREAWAELWPQIGPMIDRVLTVGEANWSEDILMFFDRELAKEEVHVTFSFSPVYGEGDKAEGMFCACTETTEKIVGNRRLETLRKLGIQSAEAQSDEEACQEAAAVLEENPYDVPFAAIYLADESGEMALTAKAGLLAEGWLPPHLVAPAEQYICPAWPLADVLRTKQAAVIADLSAVGLAFDENFWPGQARQALVLPIRAATHDKLAGLLVAGVNPRRPLDVGYRAFFDLVAGHIATAITEARAYEEEKKRAEALAELDRAKTAFFSNVSHEFRTPLTLMLGPLEDFLAKAGQNLSAEDREQLSLVHGNSLRLLKLVNTLLDFSRIEAGRVEASYEPTDLATYTAELASVFRSAVEKAGLRLILDCPPLPEPVYVDREMWEKIVLNLLSNAFKFTFEGAIVVSLRSFEDHVDLAIKDTGTGIAPEEMPRLFERFHRIRGTKSRTHEGTGIGLALVQELAKLHGGMVSAISTLGEGTTFTVSIPTGNAHLPQDRLGASRTLASTVTGAATFVDEALKWLPGEAATTWNDPVRNVTPGVPYVLKPEDRSRVLLADDNADMRSYIQRLLSDVYEVEAVADGSAALASIRKNPPDLVLTDIMMPGLDGTELLRELRSNPATRALPVILLSARAGEESRIEGLEKGADNYLVKPFNARELLAKIGAQLNRVRREEQKYRDNLEEIVEERTAEIQRLDRLNIIGEMAAGIGHEVRNPMTTVRGYLQMFQRQEKDAGKLEHLNTMIEELDRANSIITEFLSLAKNKRLDQKPTYLNAVIRKLLPMLQAEAIRDGKEIITELQDIPKLTVDENEIKQCVLNFTHNALEAVPAGGIVTISTDWDGANTVYLSVSDNGPGIPKKVLKDLGKPFNTSKENGTGLGLPICYRIAERHGAKIDVKTSPQGTTFTINFKI